MESLKKIGLLGLGKATTRFFLQQLEPLDCQICLLETNFDGDINPYLPDNHQQLDGKLTSLLDSFKNVDAILIPNITLHETLDRIDPDGTRYPVVHAVGACMDELNKRGVAEITLFGSHYSMNAPYLRNCFESAGIKMNTPGEAEQQLIDNIRRKIYAGRENPDTLRSYELLVDSYRAQTTLVVACTELSLVTESGSGVCDMVLVQLASMEAQLGTQKR